MKKKGSVPSEKENMIAGRFYNPVDKELTRARIRARYLVDIFNRSRAWNIPFRSFLIKRIFPNGADGAFFEPNIRVEYSSTSRSAKTSI